MVEMSLLHLNKKLMMLKLFRRITSCNNDRHITTSAIAYARGIRNTLQILNIKPEEAEQLTADELDDLTDPTVDTLEKNLGRLERDSKGLQRFIQQKTIKQKFFKQYEPVEENLLTWAMKEQLKYLYATDPDLWTPEALATAFPISALGVQRLLNAKWIPENEAAIERHDRSVLARWKKYTNGQLGSARLLEEMLKKRLGKSTEKLPAPLMDQDLMLSTLESLAFENAPRKENKQINKKTKFPKAKKIKSGSFLSIIEDYEALVQKSSGVKENTQNGEKHQVSPQKLDASIITSGVPNYEGSYSRVSVMSVDKAVRRTGKRKREAKKMMTLDEFMAEKDIS
ncbi:hypothetical protein SK128_019245 [Halocaridina rubra]|uniref:Neugrin n=1 Tax=Halocaridina rubra TaxID=373956 RepID=A0AAN8XGV5_HALRR